MHPPFSFPLAEKRMRRARWKRKSVRAELAPHGLTHPYEGAAGTHCRQNPEISCRLRRQMFLEELRPRICGRGVHWGAKRTPSASLSAAAPLILRGVSKGEKPQFRPFVSFQGGAGGNRNPPAFLFRGPGGHSLFKREYPLGFSVPKRYSSAGNPGIFAPKIPSPYPKWEFPCGSRKIPVLTESPIPLPYHSN